MWIPFAKLLCTITHWALCPGPSMPLYISVYIWRPASCLGALAEIRESLTTVVGYQICTTSSPVQSFFVDSLRSQWAVSF